MANKSEANAFLRQFQQNTNIWSVIFVDRPKNSVQYLADIGITANSRETIISELQLEDYSQGPLPETQFGGKEMWVFGKEIEGQLIYIKLTISEVTSRCVCISFHKAEHSMEFPFK